jgi:hypothetical protein
MQPKLEFRDPKKDCSMVRHFYFDEHRKIFKKFQEFTINVTNNNSLTIIFKD